MLTTNRYNVVTPAQIYPSGITVSVPVYINLTQDVAKAILNNFRIAKQKELLDKGHVSQYQSNSVSVTTNAIVPMTEIESQLGMDESNLRSLLFGRSGIAERTILKLQELLGMEIVSKEMILDTTNLWVDHLFNDGHQDATPPGETGKTRKTKPKATKNPGT